MKASIWGIYELEELIDIVAEEQFLTGDVDWERITKAFPDKTAAQCRQGYRNNTRSATDKEHKAAIGDTERQIISRFLVQDDRRWSELRQQIRNVPMMMLISQAQMIQRREEHNKDLTSMDSELLDMIMSVMQEKK